MLSNESSGQPPDIGVESLLLLPRQMTTQTGLSVLGASADGLTRPKSKHQQDHNPFWQL